MTKRGYEIESFKNGLGETRYRFAVPSILHPGQRSRSLNSWKSRASAHRAARQNVTVYAKARED